MDKQIFTDTCGDTLEISGNPGHEVYIVANEGENRAEIELTPETARQVVGAIQARLGDTDRIADALERIADALEAQNEPLTFAPISGYTNIGVPDAEAEPTPQTVELEDVEPDSTITFTYQGEHDSFPRQRKVRVDEVDPYNEPAKLYGQDLDSEGYRTFREDRIKSPIIVVDDA